MDLLRELTNPPVDDNAVDLSTAVRSVLATEYITESKKMGLMIGAAVAGVAAYNTIKSGQRDTIKLYAHDAYEKRMFTDIVKELTNSGRYRIKKSKYAGNGKYWELKRVGRTA